MNPSSPWEEGTSLTLPQKLTFEDYLVSEDDTENRYELIDGELVPLPPESGLNAAIANYIQWLLISLGVPFQLVYAQNCEIQVPVLQPKDAANRYPDLVVLQEEHWDLIQRRLTITLDMPPPRLVVEVVSPGRVSWERDYVRKRAQYAAREIPEYWIINPQEQTVAVLNLDLKSGDYSQKLYRGNAPVRSLLFPAFQIPAQQLLIVAKPSSSR